MPQRVSASEMAHANQNHMTDPFRLKLEAKRGQSYIPAVIRIFDPLDGGVLVERMDAAQQECSSRGEQLIAIIIRDPVRA